jgi:hypothetical protein
MPANTRPSATRCGRDGACLSHSQAITAVANGSAPGISTEAWAAGARRKAEYTVTA